MSKKISLSLFGLILLAIAFLFTQATLAVSAPIVSLTGDDIFANGGNDDPYDALVILDVTSSHTITTAWEIEYSVNSGQNWEIVNAPYENLASNRRKYYWSTSGINSSFINLRVRTRFASEVSPYASKTFNLRHRFSILDNNYVVENFVNKDFAGASIDGFWDINKGNFSLQPLTSMINEYDSSLTAYWSLTQNNSRTEELIVNDIATAGDVRIDNGALSMYRFLPFTADVNSLVGTVGNLGVGMAFFETDKFLASSGDSIRISGQTAVNGGVLQNLNLTLAGCPACASLSSEYDSQLLGNFQANLTVGDLSALAYVRLTATAPEGTTITVSDIAVKNLTPKVLDSTVYNNHLTINGPIFTNNHVGVPNSAMSFDGQNDYLFAGDINNWSLGNDFAFSAWVYLNSNDFFPIFQRSTSAIGSPYLLIENGKLSFGKTGYPATVGNTLIGSGAWHQITVSVDSPTSVKFYIDGSLDIASAVQGGEDYLHTGPLTFGRFVDSISKYASGRMSDLKFFNRSLNAVEAEKLFTEGTLNPVNVAWWNLNEGPTLWVGGGMILDDSSENNLPALAVGQAKGTVYGYDNNAGDFDGAGDYLDAGEHNPSKFSSGDSFSLSVWLKGGNPNESLIGNGGLIDRKRYGLILGDLCPIGKLGFYIDVSATEVFDPKVVCSNTTLKQNLWYHATAVYQDNNDGTGAIYLYLNGKLEGTVSGNDLSSSGAMNNLLIGRGYTAGDFNGLIDEVKIFSGAKSGEEVAHDYSVDKNVVYSASGSVTSSNLLANYAGGVLRVTLQPTQNLNGGTIEYQVSNDGVNWYGDNSGLPTSNVWYSFGSEVTPDPATFTFNSLGEKIYWRARLNSSANGLSPIIYQLRLNWQDNRPPQACFTVTPPRSDVKEQYFFFDASCSSDPDPGILNPENSLYDLFFRWDFAGDNNWTDWESGINDPYWKSHTFNSTSTFATKLEVKDQFGATSQFSNVVNEISTESNVSGWLWSSNYGWTSLHCDNLYYGESSRLCDFEYGWKMTDDYKIQGWAWNENIGWLCVGESCEGKVPEEGDKDSYATYSAVDGKVFGWGKYVLFGESGWLKLRGDWCGVEEDQCVYFNKIRGALYGWGWAGGQDGEILTGPGWSQFSGTMNIPWFETRYGTVYSRSDVGSAQTTMAPSNRYNSSYCVFAKGSIVNLTSEQNCSLAGYADLGFPDATNQYKTVLGTIDFNRLLNGKEIASESATVILPTVLDGKVYHFTNENGLTIDKALTFWNARGTDSSGAGTIIVDGDLRINKNIYYEDASVTGKIENLASVVWVVKGDIIIDPSVRNLVGLFIALGKDGVNCPNDHCGQFKTGNDTGNPTQLIVSGAIIARKIVFERTYKVSSDPAEKIIYDGRAAVNVPVGLEDIGKGLPLFRETPSSSQ